MCRDCLSACPRHRSGQKTEGRCSRNSRSELARASSTTPQCYRAVLSTLHPLVAVSQSRQLAQIQTLLAGLLIWLRSGFACLESADACHPGPLTPTPERGGRWLAALASSGPEKSLDSGTGPDPPPHLRFNLTPRARHFAISHSPAGPRPVPVAPPGESPPVRTFQTAPVDPVRSCSVQVPFPNSSATHHHGNPGSAASVPCAASSRAIRHVITISGSLAPHQGQKARVPISRMPWPKRPLLSTLPLTLDHPVLSLLHRSRRLCTPKTDQTYTTPTLRPAAALLPCSPDEARSLTPGGPSLSAAAHTPFKLQLSRRVDPPPPAARRDSAEQRGPPRPRQGLIPSRRSTVKLLLSTKFRTWSETTAYSPLDKSLPTRYPGLPGIRGADISSPRCSTPDRRTTQQRRPAG